MIENRDIIIISIQPWDIGIGSNCKDIAGELAKRNRVLYVDPPLNRITMLRNRKNPATLRRIRINKGAEPDLTELREGLWNLSPRGVTESINWIGSAGIYDLLNKRNNRIYARAISSAVRRLNFRNCIIFNDSSMFAGFYMKELLKPAAYVYYMRDNLTKMAYWRRHGPRLEQELIRKADVVLGNSTYYARYGLKFNKHSYMVGQGCDVASFDCAARQILPAEDLSSIPGPVIGYVGTLTSDRLDIRLIAEMARQRPAWSFALVGPEDDNFKNSELHTIPNVHFLGACEPAAVPRYIAGFDVCINPQSLNEITAGNYPRKIDEYLAMGKPVVATDTEAMEYFREYVYLGTGPAEQVNLVEKGA